MLETFVPSDDIPRESANVFACRLCVCVWKEGAPVYWRYRRSKSTGPNFFIPPLLLEPFSRLDFRSADAGM